MDSRTLTITATQSGVVAALVQWIKLELAETICYENRPSSGPDAEMHWTHILYRFPRPFAVRQGESLELHIGHNREKFWVRPGIYAAEIPRT
jgi:type II protein arginine methyltransferase